MTPHERELRRELRQELQFVGFTEAREHKGHWEQELLDMALDRIDELRSEIWEKYPPHEWQLPELPDAADWGLMDDEEIGRWTKMRPIRVGWEDWSDGRAQYRYPSQRMKWHFRRRRIQRASHVKRDFLRYDDLLPAEE